jgi:prepilin-type N-terminal cleavage/methylation domain-containing protein
MPLLGRMDVGMGELKQVSHHRTDADGGAPAIVPMRRAGAGFTLLELMVVVGVVAMLMAVLLPALTRVRETARRATDLSNLHQLAMACIVYAHENGGALPPGRVAGLAPDTPDNYVWLNYRTCWAPLLAIAPQLNAINSCASVREGFADASEFGKPQPDAGWPDDAMVGWIYWGGRDDLVDAKHMPQYRSLRRLNQRLTPGSPTLWTCWCWDSNGRRARSVCPHVGTRYIEYASGVVLQSQVTGVAGATPPDGLGVALIDGSASFVPWPELTIVQQANGFKLYYQP